MPRAPRADEAGEIYHALNRGNARNRIFFKDGQGIKGQTGNKGSGAKS
jgi:hypothetical protein